MYDATLNRAVILLTSGYPLMRKLVRGLRSEDVPAVRFKETWHTSHLPMNWANTIGMWGGVCKPQEIIETAGVTYEAFKMFRRRNGLKTPTKPKLMPQWRLALEVFIRFYDNHIPDLDVVSLCATDGILPIEAKFYVDRMSYIASEFGALDCDSLLELDLSLIEERWNDDYYLRVENAISQQYTRLMEAGDGSRRREAMDAEEA